MISSQSMSSMQSDRFEKLTKNIKFGKMDRWAGKVAVVTGASSGIGAQIVIDLANAGVKVVGLARRVERVEQLKSHVKVEFQKNFYAHKCDVGNEDSMKGAFKWIEKNLGAVHIMINNAGCIRTTNIVDDDNTQLLKDVVDTNLWGVVYGTREAFQSMKRHGINDGHIVQINSVLGHAVLRLDGFTSLNMYPPTKFAVTALTEVVRRELRDLGTKVKVTSISPGAVRTEIFTDDQMNELEKHHSPLLHPSDISDAIMYVLATPPRVQVHEIIIKPVGELF